MSKGVDEVRRVPYPGAKRVLDRAGAATLILLTAPLFVAAGVAIVVDQIRRPDNRGPLFYREPRISRGREIQLLKFRVLRADVIKRLAQSGARARPSEADPASLTNAGAWLKRWYLDELPQLFNVLRGDLSLVGPRPWPPEMVADQSTVGLDYRQHIIAGWTGPVQARKGDPTATSYAEIDLDYVEACRTLTPWRLVRLDLSILRTTVRTMIRGEGLSY
jgi:lipopolysaccharide/colanic/teichoic acid biosynthesis glycosyltransferase